VPYEEGPYLGYHIPSTPQVHQRNSSPKSSVRLQSSISKIISAWPQIRIRVVLYTESQNQWKHSLMLERVERKDPLLEGQGASFHIPNQLSQ
jgi:hypothetical protein